MKLIKINTDHYIIVDDSEIQEGNWVLPIDNIPYQIKNKEDVLNFDKKITHSTQPLGIGWQQEVIELSLQEVKELLGEVDVMTKAVRDIEGTSWDEDAKPSFLSGYLRGYRQALEDNKEKKYTEEDIEWAIVQAFLGGIERGNDFNEVKNKIIQSLQPKTEWEVCFVDGKLKLKL